MPVIRCVLMHKPKAEISLTPNNLLYEVGVRRYDVTFVAYTNDPRMIGAQVASDPMTPKVGDAYNLLGGDEQDLPATLASMAIEPTESRFIWHIKCKYDSDRLTNLYTNNPLNQPAEIELITNVTQKPFIRDIYGTPVQTSAISPFDPVYMVDVKRWGYRVTRNEASLNPLIKENYEWRVNANTFLGKPPGTWLMNSITAKAQVSAGVYYAQYVYELLYNENTHAEFIYDCAYRDRAGHLFTDNLTGMPLQNPTPLNGRGNSLWERSRTTTPWPGAVTTLGVAMSNVSTTVTPALDYHNSRFPPVNPIYVPGTGNALRKGPHNKFRCIIGVDDTRSELVANGNFNNFMGVAVKQTVEPEIIEVVAIDAVLGNWTVLRGREGTIAKAWPLDTPVAMLPYFRMYWNHGVADFSTITPPLPLPPP